jgi:hypothetical protein
MSKLKELKNELEALRMKSFEYGNTESFRAYKSKTEELQKQINGLEFTKRVNDLNKREEERREAMKFIFSIGPINVDLLTNDMRLDKTKRKQAPELAKLVDGDKYIYFTHGHSGVIRIHIDGQEYNTGFTTYEDRQTSEVKPFTSLEHAYECNSIQAGKVSAAKVRKQLERINRATLAMEETEKKYKKILEDNNAYFLQCEKFATQRNQNIYTTTSNF